MSSHLHSCPHCERDFHDLGDFPRIYIKAVEQLPIPELVYGCDNETRRPIYVFRSPETATGINKGESPFRITPINLPRELATLLRDSDKKVHVYGGRVYSLNSEGPHPFRGDFRNARIYFSNPDATEIFKTALAFPQTQELLQQAKAFAGQELFPDYFLKKVTEELSQSRMGSNSNNYKSLKFGVLPISFDSMERGLGEIVLSGHYYDGNSLPLDFCHPVAWFNFEGRINN